MRYSEHGGPMLADSITYRALFSIFAGVLLGFSIAVAWLGGNPEALEALVAAIDAAVPGLVGDGGLIDVGSIGALPGFTIAGAISLIGLVGAAIGAIASLRLAMRAICDSPADDSFVAIVMAKNLGLAALLGLGLAAAAAATVLGTAFVGTVAGWLGVASDSAAVGVATWAVAALVTFVLDTLVVALAFVALAGRRAPAGALWPGALIGGAGLIVLQQLSGLFVGGASSNPLLATFAALIALLLWVNLSSQVILIATSYIVTGIDERHDRVGERYGAPTFAARRVKRAEAAVIVATRELDAARTAATGTGEAPGAQA